MRMRLSQIHKHFSLLQHRGRANSGEIDRLVARYPHIPQEYVELVGDATEIEIGWRGGQYLRVWGPEGCAEMDEGYGFSERIEGAIPVGDNGGGGALVYLEGTRGWGLYLVGYGDIERSAARWIAASLSDLLGKGEGIDSCR